MIYPPHLTPEQCLQRLTYVGLLSIAHPAEQFATWLLTGTAAIIGLIIVNVDSVSNVLTEGSLRWGLSLMTLSLLCGVFTKQLGMAIQKGMALLDALYGELNTPLGEAIQAHIQTPTEQFGKDLVAPFFPPLRQLMLKGFERGAKDSLAAEKQYIKMFCILLYFFYAQGVLAAVGLIWLVFGIR